MSTALATATGTYSIDPSHSRVGFVARHAMVTKVRGSFNDVEGTGTFDGDDPEASTVEVTLQVASIDTRNEDRDNHLRTGDFFDAEVYPTIRFVSTSIVAKGGAEYEITGDLTIKDVTKSVTLETTINKAGNHPMRNTPWIGVSAQTEVLRSEWGLNRAVPNVGDEVMIWIEVELPKAQ